MDLGGFADKAKKALDSEQGEERSDQALEAIERFADEKTGNRFDEQTDKARDVADEHIGRIDDGRSRG